MSQHIDLLTNSLKYNDIDNTGFISFLNLRKILESIKLVLKDKYIEYLIYLMKITKSKNSKMDDLQYDVKFFYKKFY